MTGIRNPSSTNNESGIQYLESRIQRDRQIDSLFTSKTCSQELNCDKVYKYNNKLYKITNN